MHLRTRFQPRYGGLGEKEPTGDAMIEEHHDLPIGAGEAIDDVGQHPIGR
jgi:hypothetical protein